MEKEIIELLAGLSPDTPVSNIPRQSPSIDIKGELAFCVDTLMHTVGSKLNQSPSDVFEALLSKGINQWLSDLSPGDKKIIGYRRSEQPVNRGNRSRTPQRRQQDGNSRGNSRNDHDYDPVAVKAQQAAYDQLNEQFGYTPMTAHAVPASGNAKSDTRSKQGGSKNSTRKKYSRHTRKSQGGRSGGRRRSAGGGGRSN